MLLSTCSFSFSVRFCTPSRTISPFRPRALRAVVLTCHTRTLEAKDSGTPLNTDGSAQVPVERWSGFYRTTIVFLKHSSALRFYRVSAVHHTYM